MKTADGKHIKCDGAKCTATAYAPVALRVDLSGKDAGGLASASGWLFVQGAGRSLHFCPACAAAYLRCLEENR